MYGRTESTSSSEHPISTSITNQSDIAQSPSGPIIPIPLTPPSPTRSTSSAPKSKKARKEPVKSTRKPQPKRLRKHSASTQPTQTRTPPTKPTAKPQPKRVKKSSSGTQLSPSPPPRLANRRATNLPTSSIESEDVEVALWDTRFCAASAEAKREIALALMGLAPETPPGEIRWRYLRLSVKVHPDKMGPSATERFRLLLKVYEFLTKK